MINGQSHRVTHPGHAHISQYSGIRQGHPSNDPTRRYCIAKLNGRVHRRARSLVTVFAIASLVLMIDILRSQDVVARPISQDPIVVWSEPRIVWETTGHTSSPMLVTAAWGKVHLFFMSQGEGEGQNTLYHVDADNPDDVPIDILVDMIEYRVTADPYGKLHLIALGPNNTLIYTSVDGIEAGNASSWSQSATPGTATLGVDISADANGSLHLCYPADHSVIYQRSETSGNTWSDPAVVADMSDPTGVATYVRCTADTTGILHVAWAEARPPNYYPPNGVFYARSKDHGRNWTAPETIAGQHYSLPALLADPSGRLHMLWQGDVAVGGRYYHQRSAIDDGKWSSTETVIPAGQGGMSGDASMAVDSRGTLHLGMTVDGIFWTARDTTWSIPLDLSRSLKDLPNELGSIEYATLAIADGNELYVAFEFDYKRIYLLNGQGDAPERAHKPLNTPTAPSGIAHLLSPLGTKSLLPATTQTNMNKATATTTDLAAEALASDRFGLLNRVPTILGITLSIAVILLAVRYRERT